MIVRCMREAFEHNTLGRKYLIELDDGNQVECAVFDYEDDRAICMSCQIGCRHVCTFCANRNQPLVRNLSEDEIVEIVRKAAKDLPPQETVLDFSGIGDCSDNWENARDACRNLVEEGIIDRYSFTSLAPKAWCAQVAAEMDANVIAPSKIMISLHGPTSASRKSLIPDSEDPEEASTWWRTLKRDEIRIVVNVVLHSGNANMAQELVTFLNDNTDWIDVLRISPFNPVHGIELEPLPAEEVDCIVSKLREEVDERIKVVRFEPIGTGEDFACGQLRAWRNA